MEGVGGGRVEEVVSVGTGYVKVVEGVGRGGSDVVAHLDHLIITMTSSA